MTKSFKRLFYSVLLLFIIIRIYLQFLAGLAIKFIPFKPSFPHWNTILKTLGSKWLWLWGNFDGAHYLNIAKINYKDDLTQAFFPFYPLLIKAFNFITHNSLWSGLIISHLSFIGFIYFFLKLGLLDYSKKTVRWAAILLLFFPTSFFFFSTYTESLFFLLAAAAFYFSRKKKFLLAALLAGIASATRLIGVFLLPAILWEYWQSAKKLKPLKLTTISLLGVSGISSYLYYLYKRFNNALIFIHSQPGFGAGRQVDKIILLYQVIFRYLKMLATVDLSNQIYPVLAFEFIMALIFLALIIWALIKKIRPSYLIFMIPAYLLPTFTGSFSSMPRYVLACFPLFYLLGNLKNNKLKKSIIVISLLLLSWAFMRFSRGYWIS